ncbi:23S rRNA (adenine(2030)-N(6))-methyltransferase RlmJ [Salinarimonas soli]|uniref:Ribosomal RNA large subunit methyltransferase J n=1 Tax=Salinarimonas soli TaxID=1638099 RepID=A0A5B2VU89_9HYPH|nr:23S rRNA (adenine(2030)-N(6))-methyltransferase RlmJ [Salinarimonas soli]KAA2242230.1 23S rRNA (adenine(2030)-N(6))-methyltransferase RlmJ [Salinarimonas soli]
MNYRHAFHAGNFADVMKHVLLARLIDYLKRKDTPFRVIDTHAGIGLYDLQSEQARRTGEWGEGVGRLDAPFAPDVEALITPYRAVLAAVRARHGADAYPGSPAVAREMLRPADRAVAVELHPTDHAKLAERFMSATNVKVMHLDGWTALHALIPPRERRGLVLVDPPFETPGEMERLPAELLKALRKWPTGIFAGWYPIKDTRAVDHALMPLADAPRPVLRLELLVDSPDNPNRLNGCGLVVINPPWPLADEAAIILPALAERLARAGHGASRCERMGAAG